MPPPLHPRSVFTTSLFTTTLAISFLVVGLPHLIPCPVDPAHHAEGAMEIVDADGRRMRRRLRVPKDETKAVDGGGLSEGEEGKRKERERECPVPKPGGMVGQILGFKTEIAERRPELRIESSRSQESAAKGKGG